MKKLLNELLERGYQAEQVTIYNVDVCGNLCDIPGILVKHDYTGRYPTDEEYKKEYAIHTLAKKAGYKTESRGHHTATLIYCNA